MNLGVWLMCLAFSGAPEPAADLVVVVGSPGAPEYGIQFRLWADRWRQAAELGQARLTEIGLEEVRPADRSDAISDRERLRLLCAELSAPTAAQTPVWLVLIGHGTFDGKSARFNLRGDDLSASDLSGWLKQFDRPIAIINTASASGPFVKELSAAGRVVVTATRSGGEYNFARFGDHFSAALLDPQADLDKDEQVSLLEAYLQAAARAREFYEGEGRLATEHPLLDDNGDRLGTPPDWFEGVVAVKTARSGSPVDGLRANQWHLVLSPAEQQLPADLRRRRDRLELQLATIRGKKSKLSEDEYLDQLEPILLELSRIGTAAEIAPGRPGGAPGTEAN